MAGATPFRARFGIQSRVVAYADSATITPNANTSDICVLTSLSQTSVIANPITTNPYDGQWLLIRISSAVSRVISFGTLYQSTARSLPTATTGSGIEDYIEFKYNSLDAKWDLVNTSINTFKISRNYFKNPNFAVIQNTASGTLANSLALPTASLGYLGETEWGIASAGGTPTYAFSSANENITFTGASSTTAIYLFQRIESRDANRLSTKTITFSCEIANSLLTSVIWEVFNPATTSDTHGTIATATQTLIASGTFTVTSTLTRYSAIIALPTGVARGLEVRIRVGAQISGTWVVSRLQLEEGAIATNFNCEDYGREMQKCRRYFYRDLPALSGVSGGTNAIMNGTHHTEMFAAPILVLSGNLIIQDNQTVNPAITSITTNLASKNFLAFSGAVSPTLARTGDAVVYYNTSLNLSVFAHIP